MPGHVNGFTLAYAAAGAVVMWSGIKGETISATFRGLLSGQAPSQNQEPISGSAPLTPVSSQSSSASGLPSGSASVNYMTIAEYLVSNGYSATAAAGIVGCIAGESGGNPEVVGDFGTSFGLIQEHGQQYSGLVTGNPSKDLDAQLAAILQYNDAQGANLIQMLNSLTDPVQAADFYSLHFERPLIPYSDVSASVATSVYSQLVSKSGTGVTY